MVTDTKGDAVVLRVETAARLLDASPATVLFWIRTNKLPAFKIGRAWRIRKVDIEALRGEASSVR